MMSDQVQTYLQNKERSNQNKILDDSNFVSEDVVDTSDIVSKIEERPVQDQLTTYAEQKQEFQTQKANRTAVQVLSQDNPDENAEAQQLAKDYQTHYNPEFTLPDSIVKNNKDHIQSRVAQRKLTTTLSNSPMLLRWLGNPKNAAVASDDVAVLAEIEAGLDTVGRIVKRGGLKLQQTGYQIGSDLFRYSSEQYGLTFLDRYKLARGQHYGKGLAGDSEAFNEVFSQDFKSEADRQAALSALGEEPVGAFIEALKGTAVDALNSLGDRATQKKDINRAVRLQQRAAEVAKRLEGVEGAEGVDEYLNRFAGGPNGEPLSLTDAIKITTDILSEDPVGFFKMMGQLSLESAVGVAPAIVAAQITRNPGVGAAAMGGTSYMMESAFEAMEFFREQGVDFSDPKAVEALLGDKDLMRDLEVRRHLKALPIALLDTLSAGLAGKVFADNPVADLALQSLVQSASGGLGEALAQNVVRGQVNWGTVLLETFAEVGTAPVEVGGIGMRKLGNLRSSADDAEGAAEAIKEVSDGVQQSATRERAPEVFKDFAQGLAEDSGIESLYVPAEEFFKFLDSKNIPAVELAEKLPGLNIQDLDRARVSNEDIKIPFSEYMATIAGSDMDVFIQENAKFDPEGMTLREAANFRDNEVLEEAKVSALQEKMRKLKKENEQVLSQVRNVVEERLRATGRPEEFAKHEAEIFAAFYESVAAYTGKKVSEVVEKYKVPLVRAEQNKSMLNDDDEFNQSALELKRSPEFKNWFGDSKVVDEVGEPLVVYHGTNQDIESFSPDRLGEMTRAVSAKEGYFFTDSTKEASEYADHAASRMPARINEYERRVEEFPKLIEKAERKGDWGEAARLMEEWESFDSAALQGDDEGASVYPVYLSVQNPHIIDVNGQMNTGDVADAIKQAKTNGHDGVFLRNIVDGPSVAEPTNHYIVFKRNQAKSINNKGSYSLDDDRILYQLPGLHSTTVKAIASIKQKKGTGKQYWATIKKLPGVKKDELQWMGLEQWLNDQGKITHDEIMDYVEAHKIDIDETVARGVEIKNYETFAIELTNDYDSYQRMQEVIEERLEDRYADSELTDPRENDDYSEFESLELEYIEEEYNKYLDGVNEPESFTSDPDKPLESVKFEDYTQSGGENYTELSLQIRGTPLKDKIYRGMHFGPENTFAHARYKTRSKDETRVMHIEEIQSDLHAQGRDEGYEKQLGPKEVEKIKEAINKARGDLRNAEAAAVKVFDNPEFDQFVDKVLRLGPVDAMNKSTIIQAINYAIRFDTFEEYLAYTQETHKDALENGGEYAQLDAYRRMLVAENITSDMFNKFRDTFRMREESRLRLAEAEGKLHALHDGVLDAPFKGTGWLELTIKRLLAKAVEDGFDAISFNRGIDIAEVSHGTTVHLPDGPVEWTIDKHNKKLYVHTVIRNQLVSVEGLKVYAPDSYAELKASLDAGETEGHFSVADPVDVPSEGFVFEYDQQIPRFLNKYLKQWGAKLEYKDGIVTRIGSDEGVPFVRITPEMRESIQEAGQFYQGPRGRINIPANFDGQSVIDLFRNHDDTSFMHESAHFSLAMMIDVAENAEPDNELVHMYNDTKKWWYENAEAVAKDAGEGVTDKDVRDFLTRGTTYDDAKDKSVYRGLHEQWARGWEKYLMEGKAPNSKLQAVFELFRKIFSKVYSSLQDLDVELNEDIIRVFDRLIAVDDHVEVATEDQNFNMMADSPEKMGITPEDFEELQERFKQAQLETLGETINKAMEGVRRARSKERKEFAKSIKKEVENEINKKPIYRAIEWLGNKRWLGDEDDRKVPEGMRLSKEQLIEREGKEILRKLPRGEKGFRVYTPGGMDLDEAAGWFGYDSGDALIKDMLAVPKRKTAIKDEIAARVAAKFEDGKYEGVETASEVLSTSSKRGSFIAQELKLLNKSLGDMRLAGNLTLKYAREVARESIRTMVTRDAADAKKFLAAERREANKAQEALKAGDTQRAAGHKYSQLFNFAMHAEAKKVIEEQAKLQRLGKRLGKKSTRKKLDPEYMEAIDDILDLYDFRKRSNAQERRQEARNAGLLKYVEMMKEQGRENELAIPQHVLDNAKVRPIKSLTVEEMRGVYASLKNVENTARRSKRLIDKKRQRELDDVALSIEKAFDDNVKRRPPDRVETDREKRNRIIKQAFGAIFTADTLLREIDGFKDGGAVYENLKLGVDEAQARLENRREQAANELESLYDVYTRQEQNQMAVMRDHKFLGGTYAKWDLISIVLNMGNKDNLERLTNPKTRGAFTHAQLNYVLNQMDKRDLDFAQSVWDYIDTYYDEIAEREMRTTGVKPDKVQATALNTPHGEYRGGYYPIKYDARNSDMVRDETNEEIIQNMRIGRFGKAQTRNGHTQSRVESSGRPIRLDLSVLHGHVNAVLHDLELSEEVSNAWRVLQHPRVKNAFLDHGKQVEHEALELWIKDVASGQIAATDGWSWAARKAKSGFTISKLAFNLSTVAIQVTGLGQSAVTIGKKNMYLGLKEWSKDFTGAGAKVAEVSDFMRRRETTFNKDVYDMVGNIKTGPKMGRYKRFMTDVMEPAAFYAMQKVQYNVVDVPTWLGAYQQGLELFEGNEEKAIQHADRAVARSQASGIFGDRSAIERGTLSPTTQQSDFVRLFTTLGSYMFAKANVAYERTKKTDFKDPAEILNYTVDMTLLFTAEAVLYNLIMGTAPAIFGGADEDDEGWTEFLAKETAYSIMGTMPLVRDIASASKGFDSGGAYGSIVKTLTVPLTQLGQGEVDKAAVKAMVNAGGMLFHLPSTQMNRIIDAEWRRQEGDGVSPIEYLMGRSR